MPLLYANVPGRERRQRAREALLSVGLKGREKHTPNELSGGQQQRVAIARALVTRPRILLADEPTGNLDSRTSLEVMDILQRLNDEGLTVIVVTHEADIAAFCKRTLLFRDGRLQSDTSQTPRRAATDLAELPREEGLPPEVAEGKAGASAAAGGTPA
jgi:putative ABC transport system ATP-binding protein